MSAGRKEYATYGEMVQGFSRQRMECVECVRLAAALV
jgi:hypothetical protein